MANPPNPDSKKPHAAGGYIVYGLPPWDAYAALEAEYERDQARIEELYKQFMEDLKNDRQIPDSVRMRPRAWLAKIQAAVPARRAARGQT